MKQFHGIKNVSEGDSSRSVLPGIEGGELLTTDFTD
jgi:hypothetical protein